VLDAINAAVDVDKLGVGYPRRLEKVIDPLKWISAFVKRELS
jgi:hypothetical protein